MLRTSVHTFLRLVKAKRVKSHETNWRGDRMNTDLAEQVGGQLKLTDKGRAWLEALDRCQTADMRDDPEYVRRLTGSR
jgi:hypothetical protein